MDLKVIGTGLGRTGTMTLKKSLEQIGIGKCFHMVELLDKPKRLKVIKDAYYGKNPDWKELFEGYEATVDYPTCLFYKELLKDNPDAKVIHTTRDFDSWYSSVKETIYRGKPKNLSDGLRLMKNMLTSSDFRKVAPVFMFNDKLIWSGQFEGKFEDKEFVRSKFMEHEAEVKRTVKPENLLIYNFKEGWKPLCNFLGKPIPNVPFPHTHQRKSFNKKMDKLLIDGKMELI